MGAGYPTRGDRIDIRAQRPAELTTCMLDATLADMSIDNADTSAYKTPDWTIDLGAPPTEVLDDARIGLVGDMMSALQSQLSSVTATMGFLEDVIRDVALKGVSVDSIAVGSRLSREAIERVIAGGSIIEWPTRA